MDIAYRLRQLWSNLTSGPLNDEARLSVIEVLSPAERQLFDRYSFADQWHGYRVLRALQNAGYNHPDLLTAALLHDIGKTRYPMNAWDRTLIVIGSALFPKWTEKWSQGDVNSWRRPFVIRAKHPEWGAEMAIDAGSSVGVVELILRHQDKVDEALFGDDELLRYLQWADDRN